MELEFKMYLIELARQIIKENDETITVSRLIAIYKRLAATIGFIDPVDDKEEDLKLITRLQPLKYPHL